MKLLLGIGLGSLLGISGASAANIFAHAGVTCQKAGPSIVCVKTDGTGYGIGITKKLVIVTNERGDLVFHRRQP